jgi:hypothetical protein
MNPGTTILILLGIIGLLLYASKALKEGRVEGFALVDESQISNKGKEALADLKEGTMNLESLFGAFSTPDLNKENSLASPYGGPAINDFMSKPAGGSELLPLGGPPAPNPLSPLPPPPLPSTALPVNTPASALLSTKPIETKTTSDLQGAALQKAKESDKAPAASISSIAATAGSVSEAMTSGEAASNAVDTAAKAAGETGVALPRPPRKEGAVMEYRRRGSSIRDDSKYRRKPVSRRAMSKPSMKGHIPVRKEVVYLPRKCPPVPDMTQYIRKDQIPCWGCNLK